MDKVEKGPSGRGANNSINNKTGGGLGGNSGAGGPKPNKKPRLPASLGVCFHFAKQGKCAKGDKCKFDHVSEEEAYARLARENGEVNSVDKKTGKGSSGGIPSEDCMAIDSGPGTSVEPNIGASAPGAAEAAWEEVEFRVDGGSSVIALLNVRHMEVTEFVNEELGLAGSGAVLKSHARGRVAMRNADGEIYGFRDAVWTPTGRYNMYGSHVAMQQHGIADRSTEGYLLFPGGSRHPVRKDGARAFTTFSIRCAGEQQALQNLGASEVAAVDDGKDQVAGRLDGGEEFCIPVTEAELDHARKLHSGPCPGVQCFVCSAGKLVSRRVDVQHGCSVPKEPCEAFGQRLHMDGIGKVAVTSQFGNRDNIVKITDEHTRWPEVYVFTSRKDTVYG